MPLNEFSPTTKILSAKVNENFTGLADGTLDSDTNSLELTRRLTMANHITNTVTIADSANLTTTIPEIKAIVNGKYVVTDPEVMTFTGSKDTYVDLKDDGTLVKVAVNNGATSGMTLTTNSDGSPALRIAKIVTDSDDITSITSSGVDPLYNRIGAHGATGTNQSQHNTLVVSNHYVGMVVANGYTDFTVTIPGGRAMRSANYHCGVNVMGEQSGGGLGGAEFYLEMAHPLTTTTFKIRVRNSWPSSSLAVYISYCLMEPDIKL